MPRNNKPRISVNKLGEFLTTSSPLRRRSIVTNQKNPPDTIVARYRQAMDPIQEFLASGGLEIDRLLSCAEALRNAPAGTDWRADDNRNTALALETFLESSDLLPLENVNYIRCDNEQPAVEIAGVSVSVRPDFLIHFQKRGVECVGALKLHFMRSKSSSLRESGQEYVAMMCYKWLADNNTTPRKPMPNHCFSLDVFRKSLVQSPTATKRRMSDVEAACSEIALIWPAV